MPKLLTRQHREIWQSQGAKDMAQRVGDRARELADSHQVTPLPEETVAALADLKRRGEKELTQG
jgi:trimethylamine:corrinoid methyltransferase-like protein